MAAHGSSAAPTVPDSSGRDIAAGLRSVPLRPRNSLRSPHKVAPTLSSVSKNDAVTLTVLGDEISNRLLQGRNETAVIFAEDDEVHSQSMLAPVRVGLYEVARKIDVRRVCDSQ